uniref:uncharacterized protein LOC120954839 isoform X1 n=1 Tax=Anopheles coluzzii TaxID=1518534 RepID=UPI0020FF7CFB|nr:uncharacterized protein LOC120954839 isoform X1 [Anopheles coluzzii]XP_040231014.2 uncharacterized protein LOC120954839 isoform X1 [Anopheles coluzzii]XP_040231015.2 uncharacterized protein LOC120954839 isoform X1 [Anopheles coluzzii]XP_040231016.2 uncharacterized protein LOC120954839 isoform X1 [Anopheles coluzzii]
MSSWAQRMHRRAATFGSVVTSCGHPGTPYPHRLEKVKFGVPLEEVCKNDIPGPLLVLILKLNKEAPCRKDVFRAPGNQGAMKKLIHFLQQGRLVNVDNYSVYTIASVLKKFLRKIPGGVFGRDGEAELFQIVDLDDEAQQQEKIHRLLMSLPGHTQRLLVLLFGTFRVIASNSERADTGMTSEALGVSVAPSFFQSCVSDGKTARMKDVLRFKAEVHVATKIMKQMIEQFTACDLFGRVNYEYYARVTGRVLRVQDEWICSFRYPPPPRGKTAQQHYALKLALETEKTWLQCECERWGLIAQEESHSTPALLTTGGPNVGNSAVSLGIIPEHSLLESCARLSVSLEGPGIFNVQKSSCSSSSHSSSSNTRSGSQHHMTLDELRAVNRYAESTKSLSYLPQVHERQAARMRTRSEWFLGARGSSLELCHDGPGSLIHPQIVTSTPIPGAIGHGHHHAHGIIGTYDSIEHLYDIDVVNHQDQANHQHHYHDKQSHHHHHHQHHNPHHPSHRNTHEHAPHHHHQHHITTAVDVQKSAAAHSPRLPRIASNNEHTSTSRNATSNTGPVCLPNERHHPCPTSRGDSTTLSPVQEQLLPHRRQPTCDHRYRDIEKIEPYSDEDNNFDDEDDDDDDDLTIVPHDELDGDEGDFAISQSHHFDMRAENRRRRRRRALLRRNNSYDRIVASSADGAAKSVGDRAGSSGLAGRRRPESAPAAGEQKKNRPTPTPTTQQPSTSSSHQHAMTNPNTAVTTASTSLSNSSSSNSAPPIPTSSRRLARQHDNSSTLYGGRKAQHHHHHTSRRSSNVSHSISIGNGSTTTLSRQSNLSMIVFSVLDFLF